MSKNIPFYEIDLWQYVWLQSDIENDLVNLLWQMMNEQLTQALDLHQLPEEAEHWQLDDE